MVERIGNRNRSQDRNKSPRRGASSVSDLDLQSPALRLPLFSAAVIALVIVGLLLQWRRGNLSVGIDFYQFWIAGQAVRQHHAVDLYSDYGRKALAEEGRTRAESYDAGPRLRLAVRLRSEVETFSTPFLYSSFALFGSDYERAYQLYRALSLLSLCVSVLLLGFSARLELHWSLAFLAIVLLLYQPLESDIRVANVNPVQLLMLAAGVALLSMDEAPGRDLAAGALFGIVTAFKPNLILVVPLLVVRSALAREGSRARLEAMGALAGSGAAVMLSSLLFGSGRCWLQWREAASKLASTALPRSAGNVAPLLEAVTRQSPFVSAAAASLLVAITIAVLFRGAPGPGEGRKTILVVGLGALIYLMTAALVWLHYLLLALPSVAGLLAGRDGGRAASAPVSIVALIAFSALAIDPWSFLLRIPAGVLAPIAVASGLATLIVLSWVELGRSTLTSGTDRG